MTNLLDQLGKAPDLDLVKAGPDKPRKKDRLDLANIANRLTAAFDKFPRELRTSEIWLTGSRVWSVAYGLPQPEGADIDVFTLSRASYVVAKEILTGIAGAPIDRPPENRSHARGEGCRFETEFGAVDLWHEVTDVYEQLERYPAGYSHCRVAFNLFRRAVVIMQNDWYDPLEATRWGRFKLRLKRWFAARRARRIKPLLPPVAPPSLGELRRS